MNEVSGNNYYRAKYSPQLNDYLSLLSDHDLQVMVQSEEGYKMLYCDNLNARFDEIRCVEWSKDPAQPVTLAAGFENGKISLISYSDEQDNQISDGLITGNIVKEFNLKSSLRSKRKCNALAWNTNKPSWLAAGYDWIEKRRSGNQYSIVIWDVNKEAKATQAKYEISAPFSPDMQFNDEFTPVSPILNRGYSKKRKIQNVKEHYQLLNNKDDTTALAWLDDENDKLLSGSQKGALRLFDMQGSSPIEFSSHKKRIFSIKVSPLNSMIFASASEDQLKIFDKRKNKHPLFQINTDIQDFEFSNYHSYVLATVHNREDTDIVKFWNINSSNFESQQVGDSQTVDLKYPFTTQKCDSTISSICWCPKLDNNVYDNKYLIISDNGALNEYKYKIIDTMPIAFSSSSNTLAFTNEADNVGSSTQSSKIYFYNFMNHDMNTLNEQIEAHKDGAVDSGDAYEPETDLDDISELIVRRLNCKYGLDIDHNIDLSQQFANPGIHVVWKWLRAVSDNYLNMPVKHMQFNEIPPYYQGIASMLGVDSDEEIKQINEDSESESKPDVILNMEVYNDEVCKSICNICGWTDYMLSSKSTKQRKEIRYICDVIEKSGKSTSRYDLSIRSACIAALHFDFVHAINKLTHSNQDKYNEDPNTIQIINSILVMFNNIYDDKPRVDREKELAFFKLLNEKIWKNSYKMKQQYFNWLITLFNDPKATIKGFKKIDFMDKIAAFCRFLPKTILKQTLKLYIDQGIEEGNIETLILTGFGDRCHEVLQSYVDTYGDFQTPALIACYYMRFAKKRDVRVLKWIREYRKYLNKLRLWNVRANFDICRYKIIEKEAAQSNYSSDLNSQFKKYEHIIFCPHPMCQMSIAVEQAEMTPSYKAENRKNKYLTDCNCGLAINCSVCYFPMKRINPFFQGISKGPTSPKDRSMTKSRSEPKFGQSIGSAQALDDIKLDFSDWFTWCNTCKHAGHLDHMEEWFKSHTDCPIPDCNCQCKLTCNV